ncbi:PH domain-containing protein [Dietzia sp. B32]|uniref:PH domain-containing protein n=1 Tax=Dietzia sp. B32 TaxID=2915130 RepID=UPI0021AD54F0|nr:PH domain-containing protein [Dietzia sp. B32]UVE94075.1 PH domain-containing protein [Dietzia sp. B32]
MSGDAVSGAGPRAVSWSPGAVWPSVQIVLGMALVAIGVQRQDPLALLLTGLAALFLIPAGVSQLVRRPRLEVVDGQLAIKKLGRVLFVPRAEVVEARALGVARWGARQHLMRLEYTDSRGREELDVFTRLDLGTDPRDVVDTLHRLGFGSVDGGV